MIDEEEAKGTNAEEEKELRRVFNHVASFHRKSAIHYIISEKKERKTQLEISKKNPTGIPVINGSGNRMSIEDIEAELKEINGELEKHRQELNTLQSQQNKSINHLDLIDAIKALGKVCGKKEVQDMIWEADENLDGVVDWEELKAMFNRNLMDKTDLEPVNLFNVIQFMTYDKKLCGTITADDTMAILFARYGRAQLESRMKKLFGTSDELKFVDYLERVSKRSKTGRKVKL